MVFSPFSLFPTMESIRLKYGFLLVTSLLFTNVPMETESSCSMGGATAFMLQNGYVRAEFNKDGLLQAITTIDDRKKEKVNLVSNCIYIKPFSGLDM